MKLTKNVFENFRCWATWIASTVGQGFSLALLDCHALRARNDMPEGLPYEDKNGMWIEYGA